MIVTVLHESGCILVLELFALLPHPPSHPHPHAYSLRLLFPLFPLLIQAIHLASPNRIVSWLHFVLMTAFSECCLHFVWAYCLWYILFDQCCNHYVFDPPPLLTPAKSHCMTLLYTSQSQVYTGICPVATNSYHHSPACVHSLCNSPVSLLHKSYLHALFVLYTGFKRHVFQ